MTRMHSIAFRLVSTSLTVLVLASVRSSAQLPPLQISLEQRFARALFHSCQLDIHVVDRRGRSSLRCVRNLGPPAELASARALTSQEAERLLTLTADEATFSGTPSGYDQRGVDGFLETVMIQRGPGTIVLVSSGNPTFQTGSRRRLLDLLHSIMTDLRRRADAAR
jgi:hypothetical protein